MNRILEGKRIFVVEDDPANLKLIGTILSKSGAYMERNVLGHDITEYVLEAMPVDLILLDIKLRGSLSGYDVYDELRDHPKLKKIPVIAITSLDPEAEMSKMHNKGFDGLICKPLDAYEFPKQLARALSGEKIWA